MSANVINTLKEMGQLDHNPIRASFRVLKEGGKYQVEWCGNGIPKKTCNENPTCCGFTELDAGQWKKLEKVITKENPHFKVQKPASKEDIFNLVKKFNMCRLEYHSQIEQGNFRFEVGKSYNESLLLECPAAATQSFFRWCTNSHEDFQCGYGNSGCGRFSINPEEMGRVRRLGLRKNLFVPSSFCWALKKEEG
eukprot:GHVP01058243.1.p1 GENE.GHVP01058243.1~~GHVP01058243.1.p1  ORF type:complete len:194 (-),score=29.10 GHVP01058243.1:58-639(-)